VGLEDFLTVYKRAVRAAGIPDDQPIRRFIEFDDGMIARGNIILNDNVILSPTS
jgi:hypothetical protein